MADNLNQRMRRVADFVSIDMAAEDRAWEPMSSSMESLALKVIGGWETLTAQVNWTYFSSARQGESPTSKDSLAAAIRTVADRYNVRWPHDQWSTAADDANSTRQRLAHMLYVYQVDNETPSPGRTLAFMRLGPPVLPRSVDRRLAGLAWSDSAWPTTQQTRHIDIVTEQELMDTLATIKWLVDCCSYLDYLGSVHRLPYGRPDNYELPDSELSQLKWWFDDWGDRRTSKLTAGQLYVRPLQKLRPTNAAEPSTDDREFD